MNVAGRGVDDSPSGVEKRGKLRSGHRVRTYGNGVIVLSKCVEEGSPSVIRGKTQQPIISLNSTAPPALEL